MFTKIEKFSFNFSDHAAIKNSFNPPDSFQESSKNKYGTQSQDNSPQPQEIFNEDCAQGVALVVDTIRNLRSQPLDIDTCKQTLKQLISQLAAIRKEIAIKTNSLNAELFGRSRLEDPVVQEGKRTCDITRINNPQHIEAHEAIKKLVKGYLDSTISPRYKKEFGFEAIANDCKENTNSRYVIRVYTQQTVTFKPKNNSGEEITLAFSNANERQIAALARNPNYNFSVSYDCDSDLYFIWATHAKDYPEYDKKDIVEAEIQLKIDGEFIPGTRHISWHNNTDLEFVKESKILLQHTSTAHHEKFFNKLASLWFEALSWDETNSDTNSLNNIMADLQFCFGQAQFFYRGSPTICKMLLKGTYFERGFLLGRDKSKTDSYCTAEYYPFMMQFRKKFIECFENSPTSQRTAEFTLKQQRGLHQLELESVANCRTSSSPG